MILYCDTSALVKLYIAELHSDTVRTQVYVSEAVATTRIAWAEFHAAIARRGRDVPADIPAIEGAKQSLADDWPSYVKLEIDQGIVEKAGEYADAFALRGYDAVHLAAAHRAMITAKQALTFACFDIRLNRAAKLLDMSILDGQC